MSPVDTEKKLELVRSIRMQNQYDRQLCKKHEQLLYENGSGKRNRELYGLWEEAAPQIAFGGKADGSVKEGSLLRGVRVRIVLAMLLFLGFVFCDRNGIDILGQNTARLFEMLSETSFLEMIGSLREAFPI